MNKKRLQNTLRWIVLLLLCINSFGVSAQVTRIRGHVHDAQTGEPISDVSIALLGLPVGTITTDDGVFFIETRKKADTIVISLLGYEEQRLKIQQGLYQEFNIQLTPLEIALDEVVVLRKNPALPILDSVIRYKPLNNPKSIPLYAAKVYNKIEIDINNIDSTIFNTVGLRDLRFLGKNIDTNAATGKSFLPIFLSESLSKYYYRASPHTTREVIYASRMSGVERDDLTEFSGELYQDFNLYENYMSVFNQGLISPIHDNGTFYYHYFLLDSTQSEDGYKRYRISFRPRRKQEPTFKGYIWVDTRGYAVTEAQYELDRSVNLNFVNYVMVQERFMRCNNGKTWFPERKYFFLDLNISDQTFGFFGHKTTLYDSVIFDQPIPTQLLRTPNEVQVQSVVNEYSPQTWDSLRSEELTEKERTIYHTVDTIKTFPLYRNMRAIAEVLVNAHYKLKYFEIGPIQQFYSFNPVEGQRFAFGGRTTRLLLSQWRFSAFGAYGTEDNAWKWRGGVEYVLNRYPWRKITINASHDMEQLGQATRTLKQDNVLASVLRRYRNRSILPVDNYRLEYFHEIYTGLSLQGEVGYRRLHNTPYIDFTHPDGTPLAYLQYAYCGGEIRWQYREKFFTNYFTRQTLGSKYPELRLSFKGALRSVPYTDYSFLRLRALVRQKIPLHPIGYSWLLVSGGYIWGRVPFLLLDLHEGSNTYAISRFGYDRLDFYELVSDRWISTSFEHHFMGFFLNHIPWVRRLKFRELVGVKVLWGSVSPANLQVLHTTLPLHGIGQIPYIEAMIGLENILHVVRIDCVWRLTHTTPRQRWIPSPRIGLALQF